MHSLGLVANGQLYSSVGCNAHDYCNIAHPSGTAKDFAWKQISAGWEYSLAIGSDGMLYGWGDNSKGQLAKDPDAHSTVSDPAKIDTPAGITYTQVSTGNQHVLALDSDGNLYSWGDNSSSQLGRDTGSAKNGIRASKIPFPEQPEISDIKFDGISGTNRSRNSDGTWSVSTPSHRKGQVDVTVSWSMNGQQPDAHLLYTYIGPKYSVGFTSKNGSCPAPSGMPGNQPVIEGEQAKRPYPDPKSDGCMFDGWFIKDTKGDSNVAYDFSQPVTGGISLVAHWSPVDTHWSINPSQGNVLGGQQTTITPPDHSRGIRFNQLSAGGEQANILGFSEGVASDGNAYAWGSNQYGQLGQDPAKKTVQNTPTKVPLPDGVGSDFTYMKIAAGGAHTLAIGSNGILYSWGRNDHGQLGDNSTTDRYKPQPVNNPYTDKSFKSRANYAPVPTIQPPSTTRAASTPGDASTPATPTTAQSDQHRPWPKIPTAPAKGCMQFRSASNGASSWPWTRTATYTPGDTTPTASSATEQPQGSTTRIMPTTRSRSRTPRMPARPSKPPRSA